MFLEKIFWKTAGAVFTPNGNRARLSILTYHSVLPEVDPLCPGSISKNEFEKLIKYLSTYFNILPLDKAVELLRQGNLPGRAVAITFDDGYADNHDIALPILNKYKAQATFFIATGFLNGGIMWNDCIIETIRRINHNTVDLSELCLDMYELNTWQQRYSATQDIISKLKYFEPNERLHKVKELAEFCNISLPDNLMMTTEQVIKMHENGMTIGGHTVNHPILSAVDDNRAWQEIVEGKKSLENMINDQVKLFAYPNGKPNKDYTSTHIEMLKKAGFKAAVTTEWGCTKKQNLDNYQLSRFTPWDKNNRKFGMRLMLNCLKC